VGVAVKLISALVVSALDVSVTLLPGVEAFPVSAPVKVSVGVLPPAPAIAAFEQEKVGEASAQTKVSAGVVSEVPVSE
jgi:hypothetical protein